MSIFIAEKLKLARRMQRLSIEQLTTRMGDDAVSKMAISKIERGIIRPSEKTLKAIAKAFRYPVEYFTCEEANVGSLNFRFDEGTPKKKQQQIEAHIISEIQKYHKTISFFPNLNGFSVPTKRPILRDYENAESAANKLRVKWSIGLQPIFSAYEIIRNYGIHIIEVDIDDKRVDGVSTYINGKTPIMVINTRKNVTTERKRFTAFHELAHLLYKFRPLSEEEFYSSAQEQPERPYRVTLKCPDMERLCNRFAGAMLLPCSCLLRRIGNMRTKIGIEELISIRECYGISISAIIHRLHDLRIIDDDYYHSLFENMIQSNPLESGWGDFPIKEKADSEQLLKIQIENELGK